MPIPAASWTGSTCVDGAPLVSQSQRLTGRRWPRLAGSDLASPLLARAEELGLKVGFLGGSEDNQRLLAEKLARERPRLQVAGMWSPARSELASVPDSERIAGQIAGVRRPDPLCGPGKTTPGTVDRPLRRAHRSGSPAGLRRCRGLPGRPGAARPRVGQPARPRMGVPAGPGAQAARRPVPAGRTARLSEAAGPAPTPCRRTCRRHVRAQPPHPGPPGGSPDRTARRMPPSSSSPTTTPATLTRLLRGPAGGDGRPDVACAAGRQLLPGRHPRARPRHGTRMLSPSQPAATWGMPPASTPPCREPATPRPSWSSTRTSRWGAAA